MSGTKKNAVCLYLNADTHAGEFVGVSNLAKALQADLRNNSVDVYIYLDRSAADIPENGQGELEKSELDQYLEQQGYDPWINGTKIENKACYLKLASDGGTGTTVLSVEADLGAQDSASQEVLTSFLNWVCRENGEKEVPATQFVLLTSGHGRGMYASLPDDTSGTDLLPLQVRDAIADSELKKVNVFAEESCLMGNAEAMSVMADVADCIVASEEIVFTPGFNYDVMLTELAALDVSSATSQTIADAIVEANREQDPDKNGALTLTSYLLNGNRMSSALNEFAEKSGNFTEQDWMQLLKAFADYSNILGDDAEFVDLREVLNDEELEDCRISPALSGAVAALKTAVNATISQRKDSSLLGQSVSVYSPVRAVQGLWYYAFQYLGMTPAGNDSPWADFLLVLKQKAEAAGITAGVLADSELSNTFPDCYGNVRNGAPEEASDLLRLQNMPYLGTLSASGVVFDHLHYLNATQTQCLSFCTAWDTDTANTLTLNFVSKEGKTFEKGDFVVSIYGSSDDMNFITLQGEHYLNEDGGNTIRIRLDDILENNTMYCLQVYSPNSTAEYSIEYSSKNQDGTDSIPAGSCDRYDELGGQPIQLCDNYCSGLLVSYDPLQELQGDWYYVEDLKCDLFVTVTGGDADLEKADLSSVIVGRYRQDENREFILVEEAAGTRKEDDSGKWIWEYTFEGAFSEDEAPVFLNVAAADSQENTFQYSITIPNYQQCSNEQPVSSTSMARSGITGTTTLYWERSGAQGWATLRFTGSNGAVLDCRVSNFTARIYNNQETMTWQVKNEKNGDWVAGSEPICSSTSSAPQKISAMDDYITDIFFAHSDGVWGKYYVARNAGSSGGWQGTGETVSLYGKNQITDLFAGGGTDIAKVYLTDDDHGDAFFLDDRYSAMPDGETPSARVSKLQAVYAGAGNDVLDFTSQRYEYDAMESPSFLLYGGDGDDVLWAPDSKTFLFGDDGDDRLVGGGKDDVLIGGIGDDCMHGGGGKDLFCFCDGWGHDTVNQLSGSKVVLWFTQDGGTWDSSSMTYRFGESSVTVSGVSSEDVTLIFGDAAGTEYADLYELYVSEKVFEETASSRIFTPLAC